MKIMKGLKTGIRWLLLAGMAAGVAYCTVKAPAAVPALTKCIDILGAKRGGADSSDPPGTAGIHDLRVSDSRAGDDARCAAPSEVK